LSVLHFIFFELNIGSNFGSSQGLVKQEWLTSFADMHMYVFFFKYGRLYWQPGAQFTEDLKIILCHFSHILWSYANELNHKTVMTYLTTYVIIKSYNHFLGVLRQLYVVNK